MRKRLFLSLVLVTSIFASGCVYQAALSQGNLLDQEDIDQVEVGMTRGQVRFLLGTPMIDDPFHENRWDYVYRIHRSGRAPSETTRVTLFFEEDKLTRVEGDMRPLAEEKVQKKTEVVDVPYQDRRTGVLDRVLGTVGLEREDK